MSEIKVNKISPRTNCGTVTVGDAGDSVTVTAGVPVTVNGDLKSNALKAIDGGSIISQCGTNITLGASGDNITLACGASQTGFGRTGTVDWDTTAKTASFTAVSGNGYFVNTTSGAITVTLPASPSSGDIVALQDYSGTWGTNNVTIGRNGSNIGGASADPVLLTSNQSITLVYVDATRGWQTVNDSTQSVAGAQYVTATGGTVTCCGDYKIHTFTGPGTFTVSCAGNPLGSSTVDYLVVAGGGGGTGGRGCGGGGAGGYRESSGAASGCYARSPLGACVSALPVTAQGYPITVGAGGTAGNISIQGGSGNNSIFSSITSTGGGGANGYTSPSPAPTTAGQPGGSGGGGGTGSNGPDQTAGGSGNTPPVSPPQGQNGGSGTPIGISPFNCQAGGGGGGATASGSSTSGGPGGNGGNGATSSINATPTTRAGGGGGGARLGGPAGTGGTGGGGPGGAGANTPGTAGTVNTGGGGGGAGTSGDCVGAGAAGGSGIVIIRYKFQ